VRSDLLGIKIVAWADIKEREKSKGIIRHAGKKGGVVRVFIIHLRV